MSDHIVLDHGSGGRRSRDLVRDVFQTRLANTALNAETDAAVITLGNPGSAGRSTAGDSIAICTDAHIVKPLFFPGGDIGRLAVCGTVNDLAVSGAVPEVLTASFIIEEGFAIGELERIVDSMADAAGESGIHIVAGDTKVTARGECDGLFISTSGMGFVPPERRSIAGAGSVAAGDAVLVTGCIGDHGATIACVRNGIVTDPPLVSDCAPLAGLTERVYQAGVIPHFMRDATRGGLGTVLCELVGMGSCGVEIRETSIPIRDTVRGVCELYGFDPLYLANEGTMICVVDGRDAEAALTALRTHPLGQSAAIIGEIVPAENGGKVGRAILTTAVGGRRVLRMLAGAQLPRIC